MGSAALGAQNIARLREVLLGLIRPDRGGDIPAIAPAGWQAIDAMAALHRIQPLLHHHQRDNAAIPAEVRAIWQDAYRQSALTALVISGELGRTMSLLANAGLAPIALKGAWLAWHAYPHPALRPMRDLDILLTPETVIAGFELLQAHGYRQAEPSQLSLADMVRLDKHMPALLSPRGIPIELHQRLWEVDGRMDHSAPAGDEPQIRTRAVEVAGMRYLAPRDLLGHLIIHAVYDHRLDCGPLVLSDIAFLLRRSDIDWDCFWAEAASGNWLRGAALVLELVRRHDPGLTFPPSPGRQDLPEDLGPLTASLLLQNLTTRQSAGVFATLFAGGAGAFWRRIFARRSSQTDKTSVARDLNAEGGYAVWAFSRLWRTARDLLQADVRRQSRGLSALSRWLDV